MKDQNLLPCIPIMLPVEKASIGCLLDNGKGYLLGVCTEPNYTSKQIKPFHLYLISKREVKKGDWCIHEVPSENYKKLIQVKNIDEIFIYYTDSTHSNKNGSGILKIEATTDAKLLMKNEEICGKLFPVIPVPAIPQSYLEEYVKGYNQKRVDVEKLTDEQIVELLSPLTPQSKGFYIEQRLFGAKWMQDRILQDNDKKFSLEDIMAGISFGMSQYKKYGYVEIPEEREFFQSLTKESPQIKEVFLEMEEKYEPHPDKFYPTSSKSYWQIKTNLANEVIIHQK